MTNNSNLEGITAFLRQVEETCEAVQSGRIVSFGSRRTGFNRQVEPVTQPTIELETRNVPSNPNLVEEE